MTTPTPQEKLQACRATLRSTLIERDVEIDLCLTALVAREHVLLVGPPGTAKSMLASAIVRWLDGRKFEILLTKFSTPEEVFGPISLSGLKSDRYRRITAGKLPDCEIAFVDEIFKASSAILNTMLTVLNERRYDNDGERLSCPLQLAIAASNEWPGSNGDGKELGALFDRFVLRKSVRPITTERGLDRLLWTAELEPAFHTKINAAEVSFLQHDAALLGWSDAAKAALPEIIHAVRAEGISPGDRRLRKSVRIAQAYAVLEGHAQVEKEDLEILAHTLWDDPSEQPQKAAEIVGRIANPEGMKINSLLLEAEQIIAKLDVRDLAATASASKKLSEIHDQLKKASGHRAEVGAEHVAGEIKRIRLATVEAL